MTTSKTKKPRLRFVNIPTMDIFGTKQTENILLSIAPTQLLCS